MAAKELLKNRIQKLRRDTVRMGETGMSGTALLTTIECAIHLLLASILAGGVIFGSYAPLGVAMVAGAGSGIYGASALVGAALGYLTLLGFSDGLRYLSATILTFAVALAFSDVKAIHRPLTMPVIAGVINGCAGFIYLSHGGWRTQDVIFFLAEIFITVAVAWACRVLLLPRHSDTAEHLVSFSTQKRTAAMLLLCAVLTSLASLTFMNGLSVGRIAAAALTIAVAWRGGISAGVVFGLSVGIAFDLVSIQSPVYVLSYGVAALCAGACQRHRRLFAAISYVLGNGCAALWLWTSHLPPSLLYEVFLGSAVFLLLPVSWLKPLSALLTQSSESPVDRHNLERVQRQLESTAAAFHSLYDCMKKSLKPPTNDNDIATVFDRAALHVCKGCSLRGRCWERDYIGTFNALNDSTPAMLSRGKSMPEDYPQHFADRCLHFPAFVEAVNGELTALFYRRQYNARIRESRAAVLRQYTQLSGVLDGAAMELSRELVPAPLEERQLRRHLIGQGIEADVTAMRDHRGLLRIELRGEHSERFANARMLDELSSFLKTPLRGECEADTTFLTQLEPLVAVAGVAARKKDGETVSGDAGTYFKRDDGILYLLLCDGMGSGLEAHRESSLTVRLLEQFLMAGIDAEQALLTLSSALGLREEEFGGFTTVDLLQIDLFTGESILYKLGAAPTYIRKNGGVRKISGNSLPAGLGMAGPSTPDKTRLTLEPGDAVLMVSDGVSGTADDAWLRRRFYEFDGSSPKELAASLIADSPEGATDDRTALVVKIAKRANK